MALLTLTPAERLRVKDALVAAFGHPAGAFESFLGTQLDRDLLDFRLAGASFAENVLAVVRAAESQSWLFELIEKASLARPADVVLAGLAGELRPRAPPADFDPFTACCLRGHHLMVNREKLRIALRDLTTPAGKRILVVQDRPPSPPQPGGAPVSPAPQRTKTGKSHTVQLISFLKEARGGFELAWIDLEDITRTKPPDELIDPYDLGRTLVRRTGLSEQSLPERPTDAQWSRWVLDFLEKTVPQWQQSDHSWWVVIDAFNTVRLPQPTLDLVKALATDINVSLGSMRLVLLGYADSFAPQVLPNVHSEELTRDLTPRDLIDFFSRACEQRRIQGDVERVAQAVVEALKDLNPERDEYLLELAPRLHVHLAAME